MNSLLRCVVASLLLVSTPLIASPSDNEICRYAVASLVSAQPQQVRDYRQGADGVELRWSNGASTELFICAIDGDSIQWRRAQDSQWQQSPSLGYSEQGAELIIEHRLGSAVLRQDRYRR
ncbi:hypothetical protein [Aliagarivorans taiwanensis]|uniref:hypothetical protein n=1 Tax=Aliagarivorans taiwanensis TaxID=561966 RepID=UPI0012F8CD3B|nr:hypothetical protein [Aliagarivorans taiwanensis]